MSFIAHASACGLILDYPIADGRWHRCKTHDHPHKKNGAYVWDGSSGAVKNWATMQDFAIYRGERSAPVDMKAMREQMRRSRAEQQQRHVAAAAHAKVKLDAAIQATHPYLKAKGFPLETGFVLGADLLIPMRDFSQYPKLSGLQSIGHDGHKLFTSGMKAQGSVFKLGSDRTRERWLVEGYCTALSLRAALKDMHRPAQIICCFSAGNMVHIAPKVKKPAFVFADHDASDAGMNAAIATGLPWAASPDVGFDANDHHLKYGLRSLVELIRPSERPT